jgi:cation diffusion facilitator family transporter
VSEPGDVKAIRLAVILYVVVFALKLSVYAVSGVMVILAEALHTLSDILISSFLLLATRWSRKKADADHMFGHGRAQNVAALVAATLFVSVTSLRLFEEAVPRLFRPEQATHRHLPLALGVIALSMAIAAAPLLGLWRQRSSGAVARAQFMELLNDQLGLAAALVGTLFVLWGKPIADPIASLVVGGVIALNALGLMRENSSFLLGRSPGPAFLAEVEELALSVDGVLGVHQLRAEQVGPDAVHVSMHITVRRGTPIEDADQAARSVAKLVHQKITPGYCVIHVDPAKANAAGVREE